MTATSKMVLVGLALTTCVLNAGAQAQIPEARRPRTSDGVSETPVDTLLGYRDEKGAIDWAKLPVVRRLVKGPEGCPTCIQVDGNKLAETAIEIEKLMKATAIPSSGATVSGTGATPDTWALSHAEYLLRILKKRLAPAAYETYVAAESSKIMTIQARIDARTRQLCVASGMTASCAP